MAAIAMSYSSDTTGDDTQYYGLERLRRQYYDYLGAKTNEVEEQRESRRYYHGAQWTEDEIKTLKKRKQPVVTSNRIVRKIDAIIGLTERLRQDPKAYPRTPQQQQGADLATAVLRYVLDATEWKSKSPEAAKNGAVDGVGGIEYDLGKGDHGDPDLEIHIVDPDTWFYDPRSFRPGFADARFCGVAKWADMEMVKELVPDKADIIDGLTDTGSDLTTAADRERTINWINTTEKKVRLVDHWYIRNGQWLWCLYVGNEKLMEGISPFIDEKGKTFPKYRMFSAAVDQDGDRYSFVRNLKSPQDEINHRRSKALHNLNTRRIVAPKGAFDDVELARREAARPDGVIEWNPMPEGKPEFDDSRQMADMKANFEFMKQSLDEIENFGPNPALIGQGLEDSSGRAIALLQQAGIAELGPYLLAYKQWKIRVYRDIWNIVQRYWTSERWIRVTDDQNVAQFFQINKLQLNQFGQPMLVNALGSLDVDIIVDEGPDTINLQQDALGVLQSLGPQFLQQFPEIAIELSPLPGAVKKQMLDRIQQVKSQPPQPDPKTMADAKLKQAQIVTTAQGEAGSRDLEWRKAQLDALTKIEVARITAKTDMDSSAVSTWLEAALGTAQMMHEKQEAASDRQHELNMQRQQQDAQDQQQQKEFDFQARQQAAQPQAAA